MNETGLTPTKKTRKVPVRKEIEERAVSIVLSMGLGKLSAFIELLIKKDPKAALYIAHEITESIEEVEA